MPRLPPSLLWRASRISPLVALLLRTCRDIPSSRSELRWISAFVFETMGTSKDPQHKSRIRELCRRRARGVPLQYILGTQPFGELEIKCKPGVLIPRSETEAYTLELARILRNEVSADTKTGTGRGKQPMRILDICSGTGCIPLLLYHKLQPICSSLEVAGLDISQQAIDLSRLNISHNHLRQHRDDDAHCSQTISFFRTDIFSPSPQIQRDLLSPQQQQKWDLVISNPPYISPASFSKDTSRSVRNYEPKLALVPPPAPPPSSSSLEERKKKNSSNYSRPSSSSSSSSSNETTTTITITPTTTQRRSLLVSSCEQPEDIFYARILDIARDIRPKRILFEVAGLGQAVRVVEMVLKSPSASGNQHVLDEQLLLLLRDIYPIVEIWRDDPSLSYSNHHDDESEGTEGRGGRFVTVQGRDIPIRGDGNVRSVYLSSTLLEVGDIRKSS